MLNLFHVHFFVLVRTPITHAWVIWCVFNVMCDALYVLIRVHASSSKNA